MATAPLSSSWGFLAAWTALVGPAGAPTLARRRGRRPRVPLAHLLAALTWHILQPVGTLHDHLAQLFDDTLTDSAWADRRQRLPWAVFAELLAAALQPRADAATHPEAFWRGWRLLAIDGTQFSLRNTPAITAVTRKARTRRGPAAFAKLTAAVLLELGLHNPVAAAIAQAGESEWALAQQLLPALPPGALVLADRLYGVTAFAQAAAAACAAVGSHVLLRASRSVTPIARTPLADGSWHVQLAIRDPQRPARIVDTLTLREIRVRVQRPGARASEIRLWTTLLDPATAPALELAQLYTRRWEHELYFRELKRTLRRTTLLQSQTVATAAQEVAALLLASAVLAGERTRAADTAEARVPVLHVPFGQVLTIVRGLWLAFSAFDDLIPPTLKAQMIARAYTRMRDTLTRPRPGRTAPRAVRQPVAGWPRLLTPRTETAPVELLLV
jgi:hypothetical protein